jgi:PAS domain S-box-containing protein
LHTDRLLDLVLDGTGTGLWEWDVANDVIHWSANVGPLYGLSYGDKPPALAAYQALIHPDDRESLAAGVRGAIEAGEDYEREFRVVWPDGSVHWLHSRAHVLTDDQGRSVSVIGLISDVTERKQRETAAQYLAAAGAELGRSLETEPTLRQVAALAVPHLADWCAIHLLDDDGSPVQVAVAHQDPGKVAMAREINARYPADPDSPTGVPQVVRTGRSELYPDISEEVLVAGARDAVHLNTLLELQIRSAMVVPITAGDGVLGTITFVGAESGRRYGPDDVALAEELGRRAGLAITNVRLYAQAQQTAVTLQRSLLPDLPDLPHLTTAARYLPGGAGAEVGGDWYDVIPLASGRTAVVVGDIMGRGIAAAALMGQLRTAVRAYAQIAAGPAETMNLVAGYVAARGDVDFATVLLLTIEPDGSGVVACSAGHLPPVVFSGGDATLIGLRQGPPLGFPDHEYVESTFELLPGSTLLLYTDGLVERRGQPLDEGMAGLVALVQRGPEDPEALLDWILAELVPDGEGGDDVALLAARPR